MPSWFNNLPIALRFLGALSAIPFVFLAVGIAIFIMEPPGDSFYGGKNPTFLRALGSTIMAGMIGSVLLLAIFGLAAGLIFVARQCGFQGEWISAASFLLSVGAVLGAVYYYFEFRHYKK